MTQHTPQSPYLQTQHYQNPAPRQQHRQQQQHHHLQQPYLQQQQQHPQHQHPQHQQQQQRQQQHSQQQYPQQQQAAYAAGTADHNPVALQRLGPKGQALLQEVTLLPSESIRYVAAADGYFLGAHPIQKLVATISALLTTITGGYLRIFLVVTNQRLVLINATQLWCGWMRKRSINSLALASIAECGSSRETKACCIHSRFVNVETKTHNHQLVVKKFRDPDLQEFVSQLSAVIVANVHARTAT